MMWYPTIIRAPRRSALVVASRLNAGTEEYIKLIQLITTRGIYPIRQPAADIWESNVFSSRQRGLPIDRRWGIDPQPPKKGGVATQSDKNQRFRCAGCAQGKVSLSPFRLSSPRRIFLRSSSPRV